MTNRKKKREEEKSEKKGERKGKNRFKSLTAEEVMFRSQKYHLILTDKIKNIKSQCEWKDNH